MRGLDYNKFKKVKSDKQSTTLRHEDGHELRIAHKPLSDKHLGELTRLPMAEGGDVSQTEPSFAEKIGRRVNSGIKSFVDEGKKGFESLVNPLPEGVAPDSPAAGLEKATQEFSTGLVAGEQPKNIGPGTPVPVDPKTFPPQDVFKQGIVESEPIPPSSPLAPSLGTQPGATSSELEGPTQAPQQTQQVPAPAPVAPKSLIQAEAKTRSPEQAGMDAKQAMVDEQGAFREDLALGHIQPKTYHELFQDQSTLGKIASVFGMFLGGLGGGLTGKPNAYMEAMDKLIQRDLESQEKSNTNSQNWYNLRIKNMEAGLEGRKLTLAEKQQARAMAESDMLESTFHHLKLKASGNPSDPQVQKAQLALGQLYPVVQAKINNITDLAASAEAYSKTPQGQIASLTPAQKEADTQFAKEYTEWNSGDREKTVSAIRQLKEAKNALEKDPSLSGGLTGVLPDRLTSDRVLRQRARILNVGLQSLKQMFPGSISDSERRAALEAMYNEKAGAKTNVSNLDSKIAELQNRVDQRDKQASEYETRGTLSKFKSDKSNSEAVPETIERLDPKSGRTVVFDAKTKKPLRFK